MSKAVNEFVFVGRQVVTIGRCGCLKLPEDWRDALAGPAGKIYVRPDDDDHCLCIIPSKVMEKQLAMLRKQSLTDPAVFKALQVVGENMQQLDVEDGKVRIDRKMLEKVGINGQAVMVGAIRMVKLLSRDEVED